MDHFKIIKGLILNDDMKILNVFNRNNIFKICKYVKINENKNYQYQESKEGH